MLRRTSQAVPAAAEVAPLIDVVTERYRRTKGYRDNRHRLQRVMRSQANQPAIENGWREKVMRYQEMHRFLKSGMVLICQRSDGSIGRWGKHRAEEETGVCAVFAARRTPQRPRNRECEALWRAGRAASAAADSRAATFRRAHQVAGSSSMAASDAEKRALSRQPVRILCFATCLPRRAVAQEAVCRNE